MTRSGDTPLPPPERKAAYVREMFGEIARRYDLMNRLMTFGRDRSWRRYTVSQLGLDPAGISRVLDVATGTGDLGLEVLRQQPRAWVIGLDFVPRMLSLAQEKAALAGVDLALCSGDALRLPFDDESFDAVVTGFALRNVTGIPAAFAEMARVTRPGGRVACLEMAWPRLPIFRSFFNLYFYNVVPLLGVLIAGQRSAYTYLPHSVRAFLTPPEIADVMRRTGWEEVRYRRLMLGTVAVHAGRRPVPRQE